MKKFFFLFTLLPFLTHTAPGCLALFTTNQHGQKKINTQLSVTCSCKCKGPRTASNTCLECGHKKMLNPLHGLSIQQSSSREKKPILDLIITSSCAM